jgi:hypothetical protein
VRALHQKKNWTRVDEPPSASQLASQPAGTIYSLTTASLLHLFIKAGDDRWIVMTGETLAACLATWATLGDRPARKHLRDDARVAAKLARTRGWVMISARRV